MICSTDGGGLQLQLPSFVAAWQRGRHCPGAGHSGAGHPGDGVAGVQEKTPGALGGGGERAGEVEEETGSVAERTQMPPRGG